MFGIAILFFPNIKYPVLPAGDLTPSLLVGIGTGFLLFYLTNVVGFSNRIFDRNLYEFHKEYLGTKRYGRVLLKPLLIAFSEELFFRGLLFSLFGFIISNTLFSLIHALVFTDKLLTFVYIFFFGAVFTLLLVFTDALLAPIICHWTFSALRIYFIPEKLKQATKQPEKRSCYRVITK